MNIMRFNSFNQLHLFLLVLVGILFFTGQSKGQTFNCLQLEGLNIGCTVSVDHSCYRNVLLDQEKVCKYGGNYNTMVRAEGPIAQACASYSPPVYNCPPICNSDGCVPGCAPTRNCLEYLPPTCDEECIGCYENVVYERIGLSRGCLICTRSPCSDEPYADHCPNWFNDLRLTNLSLCSAPSRCPAQAMDPLGNMRDVVIRRRNCPPEPPAPPREQQIPQFRHCPWLEDRRSATGCEPIEEDNRNPRAFQ